ncbi:heme biosynthesis HemY N-terminal domain-containing protein [Candidatus Macondimonas diazotrophica]|jgi:HemY protein|uniref:HemY N-terminal domain-containing protein n=1 Tax=Candidatus Macondimonas diazotrophica TaxID=2305248 RepID=A0A4Z0FBT6_9GAMM|nr:heme biosynthesis HemY N-terminal domain-containing protein [Candidatus Macondimonas diazotrophica]NCU01903.1 hypothetical protein [Candidatus Macondimonas diazotrophica]TFZ83986.1 hypothetical protein E4680_00090 [Candidatus Macondimonas diazotrophica]HBG52347.1 hypothetical protein [Gammaproteobacteria bacterium]
MKWAVLLLALLGLGTAAGLLLQDDNGYVLMAWHGWTVETSLIFFVILLGAVLLLLWLVWRLLAGVWRLPRWVRLRRNHRRAARARAALHAALLDLQSGRYPFAEKALVKNAESDAPGLHYLLAARAAHRQQAYDRRDRYLHQAFEAEPSGQSAVLIAQAEMQLEDHRDEQALATLSMLDDPAVEARRLQLLVECHKARRDWSALRGLLPRLRDFGALSAEAQRQLEIQVFGASMAIAADRGDVGALEAAWKDAGRDLRHETPLVLAFVRGLMALRQIAQAVDVIEQHLRAHWSEELADLYGQLHTGERARQLEQIQSWIGQYGEQAVLLRAAARQCRHERIWGKARQYYEAALAAAPDPLTYQEFAELLVQLDEVEHAKELYRAGLTAFNRGQGQQTVVARTHRESTRDGGMRQ